jgi:hypothetical protein
MEEAVVSECNIECSTVMGGGGGGGGGVDIARVETHSPEYLKVRCTVARSERIRERYRVIWQVASTNLALFWALKKSMEHGASIGCPSPRDTTGCVCTGERTRFDTIHETLEKA